MAEQYGKKGWCSALKATEAPLQASLRSGKGNIRKERVACRGYPCVFGDFPLKKGVYCNENIARQAMQQNFPGQWKIAEEQAEIKRWKCCQVFVFFSQKELFEACLSACLWKAALLSGWQDFPWRACAWIIPASPAFGARAQVLPCLRVPNVPKRQANATVQSLQRTRAFVLSLERPLYGFLMASLDDTGSQVDWLLFGLLAGPLALSLCLLFKKRERREIRSLCVCCENS